MGFPDFNDDGRMSAPEVVAALGVVEDSDPGSTDELGDGPGNAGGSGGSVRSSDNMVGCGCLTICAVAALLFIVASAVASCMSFG